MIVNSFSDSKRKHARRLIVHFDTKNSISKKQCYFKFERTGEAEIRNICVQKKLAIPL